MTAPTLSRIWMPLLTFVCVVGGLFGAIIFLPADSGDKNTGEHPLSLSFEWGFCQDDQPRSLLEVGEDGQAYVLFLKQDHQSGSERNWQLDGQQQTKLRNWLLEREVFSLPAVLTAPQDTIVLNPGCSHLEVSADGQQITVDEANGVNQNYFEIKSYLVNLALGGTL